MKYVLASVLLLTLWSCSSTEKTGFTVEGNLAHAPQGWLYLETNGTNNANPVIVDSAKLGKDGDFKLSANSTSEALYSLRTAENPYPFLVLVNDTRQINLKADLAQPGNYTVSGSRASKDIQQFNQHIRETG